MLVMALPLVGIALSLAACAGPGGTSYDPLSNPASCGASGTCEPQFHQGPYDMRGNSQ
jgi:hypothetical protein